MSDSKVHRQRTENAEVLADLLKRSLGSVPIVSVESTLEDGYQPRPLPAVVSYLLGKTNAPDRLLAHLAVVHDAAIEIVQSLTERFPDISLDAEAVCLGAATHDLGKVLHPHELTGPGNQHEKDGPELLEQHGLPSHLARFARTHGAWSRETLPLDDLLVALADTVWKGQRIDELESQVVARIVEQTGVKAWEAFDELDGLLQDVASQGDERLAWQQRR